MDAGFILKNIPSLFFRRELSFQFDRIPLRAIQVSALKRRNLMRIALNRFFPISSAAGFPYMAHISPSGLCNLSCNFCPAHSPEVKGKELLSFDTFKKFLDEVGDYLIYIIMWSWGEPLLNPEMPRMIQYAKEKGVLVVTSSNLNTLGPLGAKGLISSGLDALIVAADGASEETYQRLRKGGSLGAVVENTKKLLEERDRMKARHPLINLRMVVSRENEHEIEDFKQLASDLGVDMVSLKAFSTRQAGTENPEIDKKVAPRQNKYRWYRYLQDYALDREGKKYNCKFPWTKPNLSPDGTIIFCEFDLYYEHPLGNINQQDFQEIWFSQKAKRFRRQFKKDRDAILFCQDCVFDYKRFPGCVIEWEMLNAHR